MSDAVQPLVSIGIPAYRAEKYLRATLDSIATQTYPAWEVIVVEDGSKDAAEEIVRAFAGSVKQRCVYERHEKNRGLPATRNTGIGLARGEWVAFLDSDDLWEPAHLANAMTVGQRENADLVFAGTQSFDSDTGQPLDRSVPTENDLKNLPVALFSGTFSILPSSVVIGRETFQRFGQVSLDYPHVNDTEFWLRILRAGGKISYSGEVTCRYRKHPQSMSRRLAELLEDSARLCEAFSDWPVIPRALARQRPAALHRWAALTLLPYDRKAARRSIVRALKRDPLNPRNVLVWAKSLAPISRSSG